MSLIRKRLAVEMWIYDQLNKLHGCTVSVRQIIAQVLFVMCIIVSL